MPDPTDPRAVAAQPALGYDTDCPECSGTGQRDSGGTHPWGEPAMMMCDCDAPPPAAPTDNTALVEDHICELNRAMNGECMTCGSIDQAMAQEQRQADLRHAALANREAPPACQQEALVEALEIVKEHSDDGAMRSLATRTLNKYHAAQEPVAWRCKDYADDWIIYRNKSDADQYQAVTGCLMQPLYAAPQPASQQEAVTERALLQRAVDLIKGDLMGSEWKRACNAFVKDALRALKGKLE